MNKPGTVTLYVVCRVHDFADRIVGAPLLVVTDPDEAAAYQEEVASTFGETTVVTVAARLSLTHPLGLTATEE